MDRSPVYGPSQESSVELVVDVFPLSPPRVLTMPKLDVGKNILEFKKL